MATKTGGKIKWTETMDKEVEQLRSEGWSWDRIGERFGVSGKSASMRWYTKIKPVHIPNESEPQKPTTVETDIKNELYIANYKLKALVELFRLTHESGLRNDEKNYHQTAAKYDFLIDSLEDLVSEYEYME